MSWKDNLQSEFYIITGDGIKYTPELAPVSKESEFNISSYEFIDQKGSFVNRKEKKGSVYEISIYFQGEDCISLTDEFDKSSEDKKYWIVNHPIYGRIQGHPSSIKRNDISINVIQLSITFLESLRFDELSSPVSYSESVKISARNQIEIASNYFESKNKSITPLFASEVVQSTRVNFNKIKDYINKDYRAEIQKNISEYLGNIDSAIKHTSDVIKAVSAIMVIPASLEQSLKFRFNLLENMYKNLFENSSSNSNKKENQTYNQAEGSVIISQMCECVVTPLQGDFEVREDVVYYFEKISFYYDSFIQTISEQYEEDFGFEVLQNLNKTVINTLYYVLNIVSELPQERVILVSNATNLVVLTHRFLGLDENDENIEKFRKINNIKNNRIFQVRQGLQIKYYTK